MSSNSTQNDNNQEIDLGQMMNKIGGLYQKFLSWIFQIILYLKTNLKLLLVLVVIGVLLGFFLGQKKSYKNEIIVTPNFGSVNYLYTKIDLLNSKIRVRDTAFLKSINIKEAKFITGIKIKPIIDIYGFIEKDDQKFDLIKLMAEESSIDNVIENKITSKNYPNHLIEFISTSKQLNQDFTNSLLSYLNESQYYKKIQDKYVENLNLKQKENDTIISKIYGLVNKFSNQSNPTQNNNLVYYNNNTQLNDLIKTQEALIQENGRIKLELVSIDKIVKDMSITQDVEIPKFLLFSAKVILPILFILVFLMIDGFRKFYKSQINKH